MFSTVFWLILVCSESEASGTGALARCSSKMMRMAYRVLVDSLMAGVGHAFRMIMERSGKIPHFADFTMFVLLCMNERFLKWC